MGCRGLESLTRSARYVLSSVGCVAVLPSLPSWETAQPFVGSRYSWHGLVLGLAESF